MSRLIKQLFMGMLVLLLGSIVFAQDGPSGTITLWGWSYDSMDKTGLIDAFKKEYPNIDVQIVVYNANDTYQNLQLACSAGQGAPDVVQIENSHLAGYVALDGCLTDITDHVEPMLKDFNAYKWKDAERDGRYYAVPWDSGPVVLYYRQDIFKDAGLPTDSESVSKLVSTWDGYLNVCQTVMDKTGHTCFANSRAANDGRLYEIMLWQQGLGYYDEAGKVTVDSPQNVATLEKLGEFWTAGVTSDSQPWTDPWYAELGGTGADSTATLVEASWMGVFLKTWIAVDIPGAWGVAYMPAFADGQVRAANDGGSTLAIPAESQNKDAAWAFIEFMLARPENQITQFAYNDFLPALESTYSDPIFNEPDPFFGNQTPRQIYLDVAGKIPAATVYGPYYSLMNNHVATAIQKFATAELSAQDALTEAADTIRRETGLQ
jgi:lactose/L-arabinose transport system substrate-binding protein